MSRQRMARRPASGAIGALVLAVLAAAPAVRADAGPRRVALRDLARQYALPQPVRAGAAVLMRNACNALDFEPFSRKLVFDRVLIWLNDTCAPDGAGWTIAACDAQGVVDALLRPRQVLAATRVATVVLDAGHGGKDSGARGRRGASEKKIALDIARRVRVRLQSCGVAVRLTRQKDEDLSLPARTGLATQWKADLFLSIHLNSARNGAARGVETYVVASEGYPSTAAGRADAGACAGNCHEAANGLLAYYVHKGVVTQTGATDRGIKRARFELLRTASCPAALVECGFVSNSAEERRLNDSAYRDRIAEGITRGILTFVSKSGSG